MTEEIQAQDRILQILRKNNRPMTASEIADHDLDLTVQATRRFMESMHAAGLVEQHAKPGERTRYSLKESPSAAIAAPTARSPALSQMSPAELLKLATNEAERHRYGPASEHVQVIDELRKKRFTWKEISAWLRRYGFDLSPSACCTTHKRWQKDGGR